HVVAVGMGGDDGAHRRAGGVGKRLEVIRLIAGVDEQRPVRGITVDEEIAVVVHLPDGGLVHVDGPGGEALDLVARQVAGVVVVDVHGVHVVGVHAARVTGAHPARLRTNV